MTDLNTTMFGEGNIAVIDMAIWIFIYIFYISIKKIFQLKNIYIYLFNMPACMHVVGISKKKAIT